MRRLFLLLAFAAAGWPAQTPETVEAQALRQIEAGEFQAAAAALRTFLTPASPQVSLWNLLGICESELHHAGAAREAFLKALKLNPGEVSVRENLGLLSYREGDYAGAKEHLAKAVSLGSIKPGVSFHLAAAQLKTGERAAGLASLKRLEASLSGVPDYWNERGWAELKDDAAAAEKSFARALALAPEDSRALNGAASASEAQGRDEEALSYLLRARKAHPDELRTLLHFGSVCLRRDLAVDALAATEHAYKLAPSNNLALFWYARAYIASQQWERSHELFAELAGRAPRFAPAQYVMGWLDLKLNRRDEARQHLNQCLQMAPDHIEARYELGQLDLSEGRFDTAAIELRKVLDKEPRHAKANLAFGDLLWRQGNAAEAKAYYERSIEADPKSGPAHYKLSTVLLRLQERKRAEKERALGVALNAEAVKASKNALLLAEPDGTLLSDSRK